MAFSTFIRSSRCVKSIAIGKFSLSIIGIAAVIFVSFFMSSVKNTLDNKSSSSGSSIRFYFEVVSLLILLAFYAASCFALFLGAINRDFKKVAIFLLFDYMLTFGLIYGLVHYFPSVYFIIALPLQIFLLYAVMMFVLELRKEHLRRLEIQQTRRQTEEARIAYEREIEQYHARLKKEEEEDAN